MPRSDTAVTIKSVKLWRQWADLYSRTYDTCYYNRDKHPVFWMFHFSNVQVIKSSCKQRINHTDIFLLCLSVKLPWLFNRKPLNLFHDQSVQIWPHLKRHVIIIQSFQNKLIRTKRKTNSGADVHRIWKWRSPPTFQRAAQR